MTRTFTTLFLGALAVFAFGCGAPAAQSAGPSAPPEPGAAEVGKCKTPEGATAHPLVGGVRAGIGIGDQVRPARIESSNLGRLAL